MINSFIFLSLALHHLPAEKTTTGGATSPYCGIYSVYSIAKHFGREIDFKALADPKYVSDLNGSTVENLLDSLKLARLVGYPLDGLRLSQLQISKHPTILHVRIPSSHALYRHWVVFQGVEDGNCIIYDPPHGILHLTPAELLAIWDGKGIIVILEGENITSETIPETWIILVGFSALLFAIINHLIPRFRWLALVIVALLLTCLSQILDDSSFIYNPEAVSIVNAAHFEDTVVDIDIDQFLHLQSEGNVRVIDARFGDDYKAGHIPSAINLPVVCGYGQIKSTLAKIPKNSSVVCYCNNENCGWSDAVANQFIARGYKVFVYRSGVKGWREAGLSLDKGDNP